MENNTNTRSGVVLRAGIWYTVCSFLTKGISFITTPIFARLMSSEEYGDYSNFVAWFGILAIVTTMEMHTTVNRARFDFENLDEYLSTVALSGTGVTLLLWGVVLLFRDFFTGFFSMEMPFINLMFLITTVSPAMQLLQAKNRIRYKYKNYVAISLGSVLVSTLVSLAFVLLMQNRLAARLIGHYGTAFLIDLAIYIVIICKGKHFKWSECKYALSICLPIIPYLLSKHILSQSDRIMIKQFCGATDTAYYSLAYSCSMIPMILANAANTAWSPWSGERIHEGDFSSVRKASYYYLTFFYVVVLGMITLGPEVLLVFGGKKYAAAVDVLPPVVISVIFHFLCNLLVALEQFAKKTVGMAFATIFAALLNLLLNRLLIPKYGYVAAAYTTLVGYAVMLVIHYFLAKRTGYLQAYDIKFIFLSVPVLLILMFIILWLYTKASVFRYIIAGLLILAAGAFLYKKRSLLKIFKS